MNKKSPLKWVVLALVAILCVGSVAYAAPKIIKKVKMAGMSPEERYRYIEKNNIDNHLEQLLVSYDSVAEEMKKDNFGTHQTMKLDLSDTAKSLLSMSGVDFSELKTIEIDLDSNAGKDKAGYTAALVSENEKLITANVVIDGKAGDMLIQIPEISESYIRVSGKQLSGSSDVSKSMNTMSDIGNKLPTSKEIKEIADLCTETFLDNVKNIKTKENSKISAENFTEEVTNYVISLNQKETQTCIKAVANKLKDDKTLKTVITRFDENAYTSFTDAVNDINSDSEGDASSKIDSLRMTVSVNDSDTIIGRNIEALDADGKVTFAMSYCIPSKRNKFGFNLSFKNETETVAEVTGTGNVKSDVLDGTFTVKSKNDTSNEISELATIKVDEYDFSKADKAKSKGKILISLSNSIPQIAGYSLAYEFDVDGLSSKQTINIMAGSDKFASLILDSKLSSDYEAKLPGDSDTVIDSDDSTALSSYADMTKVQSVLNNIFTKLGLDSSIINSLFTGSLGNNFSNDYNLNNYNPDDSSLDEYNSDDFNSLLNSDDYE